MVAYPGPDCMATAWIRYDDPTDPEENTDGYTILRTYNDNDFWCIYKSEEDFQVCHAYYRISHNLWEFAHGGAWLFNSCGDSFDEQSMI